MVVAEDSNEWTVSALYTYPVKSCQGVRLHESQLTSTGLEYDRLWMLVDARSKRFVTQRQLPRLALVQVTINQAEQLLELSADSMPPLQLPLHPQPADLHDSVSVRVWYDMVEARRCGDAADSWVTQLVGRPTWLLYKDPQKPRLVSRYVPQNCKDAPQSGFADVFPLHVTTEPSLDDVNSHVPRPLSQQHFRPNIVLRSPQGKPYAEEEWTRVEVGPKRWSLFFTSRTPRCSMPNVDLETGQMSEDKEPMATMRTFRCVDPGKPSFVCFGMQAAPQTAGNFIKVGDSISVCERGFHSLTEPL
ncbi:hypothetical protein LPJ79_000063 [Coemansia sp. RSA 1821]|nr:hypothetical protein LPJ68_000867 [Coemansia sp. RSA 1086]KAJ1753776.1 hypothetical protein LPJ79_000063 [Coemansia sp. RSA 1821]